LQQPEGPTIKILEGGCSGGVGDGCGGGGGYGGGECGGSGVGGGGDGGCGGGGVVKDGMKATRNDSPAAREPIVKGTRSTSEITEDNTVKNNRERINEYWRS